MQGPCWAPQAMSALGSRGTDTGGNVRDAQEGQASLLVAPQEGTTEKVACRERQHRKTSTRIPRGSESSVPRHAGRAHSRTWPFTGRASALHPTLDENLLKKDVF